MKPPFKNSLMIILTVLTLTFSSFGVTPARAAGIRYAKPTASGTGNCSSWVNACTLQTALTGAVDGDEIWVMAGTHKPTTGTDRNATFELKNGVAVYGGFAGTETARDQRDFETYVTTLTGDLNGDDIGFTNNDENVYHVVTGATGATLDGFTVTAGNASGANFGGGMYNNSSSPILSNLNFNSNWADNYGGGMYNTNGSNPALTNVTFNNNSATPPMEGRGGGMYNNASSPTLTNVTFSNNSAEYCGGMFNNASSPTLMNVVFNDNQTGSWAAGMCNTAGSNSVLTSVTFSGNSAGRAGGGLYNGSSNPTLTNVIFSNNSASEGGGMANYNSSPTLTNVTFSNNLSTTTAGGGGMYNASSNPTLTNVTFYGNHASSGGGIKNYQSNPVLVNVTFSNNSASSSSGGGGILNDTNSNSQIRNTIFWGNTAPNGAQIFNNNSMPIVSDSVVQSGYAGGTNIITSDPLLGTLGDHGGFTQTIPLLAGSSAFDSGNDATCAATDQRGVTRPQGARCDIGAFEVDLRIPLVHTFSAATPTISLTISITAFEATDDLAVTGYMITESSAPPAIDAPGWTSTAPTTYAVFTDGTYTLYPWVKDSDGNVSEIFTFPRVVVVDAVRQIFYVTPAGTGNCSSWANACKLQTALTSALSLDEIWVTAGTHKPTTGTDRTATFHLKDGVAVYGGFSGTETSRGQRDFQKNLSILSGEIGVAGNGDNSYHVLIGATGATLDGFLITAGNANGASPYDRGGGMFNSESSPTLTNLIFDKNSADDSGGGMHNTSNSNPTLMNVTFSINYSNEDGGGMSNYTSSPTLTNVTFSANHGYQGGGVANAYGSSPIFTNVTFNANHGYQGGGMFNYYSNPTIRNTIFWSNTGAGQIYNFYSNPVISDSVVQGGIPVGTNIITADPMLGALDNYGGFTPVLPLLAGSSAIDAGNDTVCPDEDQRGMARPHGAHCDIGAYEYGDIQTFSDVPVTHWAWDYVERLYAANITDGCGSSPRIYCPEKPVTRAQMAIFIERGMNGSAFTPPPASGTVFGDVVASYWAAAWVEQLAADNITGGCGNGNYCPDNPVTRAQMAVFLLKAMHGSSYLPPVLGDNSGFADVPNSYWAAAWIKQLAAEGITGGCGAGNYCPDRPVTRAQMAVFLVKAFNLP